MTYKEKHEKFLQFIRTNNEYIHKDIKIKKDINMISLYSDNINGIDVSLLPLPYLDEYCDAGPYLRTSRIQLCLCKSYGYEPQQILNLLREEKSQKYPERPNWKDIDPDIYCYSDHVLSYISLAACHDMEEIDENYLRTFFSIYTIKQYRQQGWAEAIIKIVKKLFINTGIIDYIGSMVEKDNIASINLHKKVGAQEIKIFDYKKQYPKKWNICMDKGPNNYKLFKII